MKPTKGGHSETFCFIVASTAAHGLIRRMNNVAKKIGMSISYRQNNSVIDNIWVWVFIWKCVLLAMQDKSSFMRLVYSSDLLFWCLIFSAASLMHWTIYKKRNLSTLLSAMTTSAVSYKICVFTRVDVVELCAIVDDFHQHFSVCWEGREGWIE